MVFLALDFDGVVSNSARECFVTGLGAYLQLEPSSRLSDHPCHRMEHPEHHELSSDPLFRGLLELIPLGNRAEDFGVAFRILDRGADVDTQQQYDRYMAGIPRSWLDRYHRTFYEQRNAHRQRDLDGWLSLSRPYPEMIELLRRHRATPMAFATAKDSATVRLLLDRYGLGEVFPDERILDKDTGVDKRAHLQHIRDAYAVSFTSITFVDDKVNHLEAVAQLGVRCVLAGWGFNTEREHRRARQLGFEVCALNEAEALFTPES